MSSKRVTAAGIGSMPGEDFAEATRLVLGECPDFPQVPELPGRGVIAGMTGRALAMIDELGFDLQPAGWRLTDSSGIDHRRAKSLLAQDLDVFEELSQGYVGPLKLQVAGPWTLAATVERPRGDRLLADVGARSEVVEALALGILRHVADVKRRVPGADIWMQLDEPALPAVMAGRVPTASGFHRHRSVDSPAASAALELVFGAVNLVATTVAHCCDSAPPISLFRGAGAAAVSIDATVMAAATYEELGVALDAGETVFLGLLAAQPPWTSTGAAVTHLQRLLDMLGFDVEEAAAQLVLTPTCGLAQTSLAEARGVLRTLGETVRALS